MSGPGLTAKEIAARLGGKWHGRSAMCLCPAHKEKTPSLHIQEGEDRRTLVKCFGGCSQADVINALRRLGLWGGEPLAVVGFDPRSCGIYLREKDKSRHDALKIWDQANPAKGTAVEEYLLARGIKPPPTYWGELRYAPRLKHHPSGKSFRAMIARISDDRGFCGIQRTYLDATKPQKADVMPNKMSKGPMEGGAVRLRMPDETLGLAEGVETALSARQLYSMPVWATLSCVRLKLIEIPKTVKFLSIFGDPDGAGKAEAFEAIDIYESKGLQVELYFPGSDFHATEKADFNTVLKENAARKYD